MGFNNSGAASGGSSTMTIGLNSLSPQSGSKAPSIQQSSRPIDTPSRNSQEDYIVSDGTLPLPNSAPTPVLQRWNQSRSNVFRVFATFYSFTILGLNDGAYGALIPYLEEWYHIDYTVVSLVFLSPLVGYVVSGLTNNAIHMRFGQRGIAIIMSVSHVLAYTAISLHIPYPALVVFFILAGFGNGLGDAAWNAWIGDMANANEVLGFLHAFYGLGATIAPLVATTVVTKAGWRWFEYYYLMVGAAVLEVFILAGAFWTADGAHFRADHSRTMPEPEPTEESPRQSLVVQQEEGGEHIAMGDMSSASSPTATTKRPGLLRQLKNKKAKPSSPPSPSRPSKSRTIEAVRNRVTLLAATFLLVYVGIEVSIGGWIVTFMLRVRHGTPFASGLTSTGFWLGVTVGRLVLGFVTARVFRSEKEAVATYILLSIGLQILFWLVPRFLVSAVTVALLGFFLAPMFPAAIVAMTKLLPKHLHVPSVGFAAAVGASGACVFPFAVGAIANAKGVQVLQPIILAMLCVMLAAWWCIPKLPKVRTA